MIGYCPFVCLSVCDAVPCGKTIHPTAKSSEQVNRKCPYDYDFTTYNPYTDLSAQTPYLLNRANTLTHAVNKVNWPNYQNFYVRNSHRQHAALPFNSSQ